MIDPIVVIVQPTIAAIAVAVPLGDQVTVVIGKGVDEVIGLEAALASKADAVAVDASLDTVFGALDGKAPIAHGHAIADVTGLQAELDGIDTALAGKSAIGHGHAVADVAGLQAALDGKAPTAHDHAIANVTGLQAELDGIDTALAGKSAIGHGHAVADVAGLQAALDSKAAVAHDHAIANVTGLQAELDGIDTALAGKSAVGHGHAVADVAGLQAALDGKAPTAHDHAIANVTGLQAELDGIDTALAGKSAVGHGHAVADVAGLQAALDGKAPTAHDHAIANVTGLQAELDGIDTALAGKSVIGHGHAVADVAGLQAALDGKAAVAHTHAIADVTGLQAGLDGKQPLDGTLTALAGVATSANKVIYATGADTFALADLTAFGRSLIDDADAATARGTLGLGTAATQASTAFQAVDATLTALAAVVTSANKIIYATGADAFALADLTAFARTLLDDADAATMRATLGLGTAATQASTVFAAASHTHVIADVTGLQVAIDGKQPLDATLTALAGVVTAANKVIYATAADTFATADLTAFGRSLIDDADAAAGRVTLGLGTAATQASTAFASAAHTHAIADVTGLQTVLDGKAASAHSHVIADVTGLQGELDAIDTALAGTAAAAHGHAIADVTGLQAAIDGKQPLDATLTAFAALTTVADKIIYATGPDAFALADLTAFARSLLDDADAATMRATLGLGTAATQASSVFATASHTHVIADVTGLQAGLDGKQPLDATLTALAGVVTAANKFIYATAADTFATADLTAFGRSLIDDADAAAGRATLGLGTAATQASTAFQAADATLTALAGVVTSADKLIYATGVDTFALADLSAFGRSLIDDADAATMRGTLGLGTAAVQASTAFQAADATLTALAGVVTSANKMIYATGADVFALADLTAFARTLLDDADAATMRTTLGLGTAATQASTAFQAADATLTALAALTTSANKIIYATAADAFAQADLTAFARTLIDDADAATMRATLGLGTAATQASTVFAAASHTHVIADVTGLQSALDAKASLTDLANVTAIVADVRQTVLSGPVDSNGIAAFGGVTGGTVVTAAGTLIVTAADGHGIDGAIDRVGSITNPSWTGLATNGNMYLCLDVATDGTCTPVATTVLPVEIRGGAAATTNGLHTFNITEMKGYLGNGSVAAQAWRVIVGEVTVASNVVSAIVWYALRGEYVSSWVTPLPAASTATDFNSNIGSMEKDVVAIELECITANLGFSAGMRFEQASFYYTANSNPVVNPSRNVSRFVRSDQQWWSIPYGGAAPAQPTAANWKYRIRVRRSYR